MAVEEKDWFIVATLRGSGSVADPDAPLAFLGPWSREEAELKRDMMRKRHPTEAFEALPASEIDLVGGRIVSRKT